MKIWIVVAFVIASLVTGFSAHHMVTTAPVPVAIDAPLSARAAFDPSEVDAVKLYLENHPESRIHPQFFFYDFDSEQARGLFQSARDEGIEIFITTQPSSTAIASIDAFQNPGMLMINTSSTTLRISGRDDYIIRIIPDLTAEQYAIAEQILSSNNGGRLLILQDAQNAAYTDPAYTQFQTLLNAQDRWRVEHHRFSFVDFNAEDYRQIIHDAHDALYVLAGDFQTAIGTLSQMFHRAHPTAPIYLTPWSDSGAIISRLGPAAEQATIFKHAPAWEQSAAASELMKSFIDRFGYQPNLMVLKVYKALELVDQAIAAGHTSASAVRAYLLEAQPHTTSLGDVPLDRMGDTQGEFTPVPANSTRQQP